MEKKTSNDLANYRLERAKLDLADASQTQSQIESAQYIIKLVEEYLQKLE